MNIPLIDLTVLWIVIGTFALFPVLEAARRAYQGWGNIKGIRYLVLALLGIAFNQLLLIVVAFAATSQLDPDQMASVSIIIMTVGHVAETVPLVLFALYTIGLFDSNEKSIPSQETDGT